jgi:hypothetical protein
MPQWDGRLLIGGRAAAPQSDGVWNRARVGWPREHHAGIDVSLKDSSVCVMDATGRIMREAKVASEPQALIAWFRGLGLEVTRIGLGSRHCRERTFVAVAARWPWRGRL